MEALACCEIREEEDSRGQRVAGMVQPLRPALAESTAALAEMTARLGGAGRSGCTMPATRCPRLSSSSRISQQARASIA